MFKNTESSSGVLKVARKNRNAYETGKVDLNDVLNFINSTNCRNLRIIRNVLVESFAKYSGTFTFKDVLCSKAETYILTSDKSEFARLEQAMNDRRRVG